MDTNPQTNPDKLAHSVDESCAIAGVGRSYLYGAIAAGDLTARKAGRRTLILRSDLEAWLTGLPTAAEPAS
jgi:excisionase family DNA binding protein